MKELTEKEVILIAEFMGYDTSRIVSELPVDDRGYYTDENGKWVYIESLQYKRSWDHLMKVVEKIESLEVEIHGKPAKFVVFIKNTDCTIRHEYRNITYSFFSSRIKRKNKLEMVYGAVVEFIKWFNINKN